MRESFTSQANTVIEKLCERFVDPEKPVRAALHKLFVQQLLPKLGGGKLLPFLPLLMAHVSGAMTHLEEGIRSFVLSCPVCISNPGWPT